MRFLRSLKKEQKQFAKVLLKVFAVLLIFGGPTYLLYVLDNLGFSRLVILVVGIATFIVGIILFVYLSKEEEKAEPSN